MAIYKIAYDEFKINGERKKKQGARVERFRKLLQRQRVPFEERWVRTPDEGAPEFPDLCIEFYKFETQYWSLQDFIKKNGNGAGEWVPFREIAKFNEPGRVHVIFTFNERLL